MGEENLLHTFSFSILNRFPPVKLNRFSDFIPPPQFSSFSTYIQQQQQRVTDYFLVFTPRTPFRPHKSCVDFPAPKINEPSTHLPSILTWSSNESMKNNLLTCHFFPFLHSLDSPDRLSPTNIMTPLGKLDRLQLTSACIIKVNFV